MAVNAMQKFLDDCPLLLTEFAAQAWVYAPRIVRVTVSITADMTGKDSAVSRGERERTISRARWQLGFTTGTHRLASMVAENAVSALASLPVGADKVRMFVKNIGALSSPLLMRMPARRTGCGMCTGCLRVDITPVKTS